MPYCAVLQCKNDSRKANVTNDGVSYHRFPKDPYFKAKWIIATGRLNWLPTKKSTICSKHFAEDDLYISYGGYRLTKDGAVPTLKIVMVFNQDDNPPSTTQIVTQESHNKPISYTSKGRDLNKSSYESLNDYNNRLAQFIENLGQKTNDPKTSDEQIETDVDDEFTQQPNELSHQSTSGETSRIKQNVGVPRPIDIAETVASTETTQDIKDSLHYEIFIKSEPEDDDDQSEPASLPEEKEEQEPPTKRARQSPVVPETPELAPLLQDVSTYLQSLVNKKEDSFDSFGKYVATVLRSMPMHVVIAVKPLIVNLLVSNSVNPKKPNLDL